MRRSLRATDILFTGYVIMSLNIVLVGVQNSAKLKEFFVTNNIPFAECQNHNQVRALLKKGFDNRVFFFGELSESDGLEILKDSSLYAGKCSAYKAQIRDDILSLGEIFTGTFSKTFSLDGALKDFEDALIR